jgi:phospholipid/cholesterol/gamma-HCH transport system substrate-binding protein
VQTFVEYQKKDLLIGAFVVLSLVVLVAIYFLKSQWWGASSYTVMAEFSQISSLKKGVKVRLRGYEIGKVRNIDFFPTPSDGVYFRVELAVENQYPLFEGTTAKIGGGGLLGDKYINLDVSKVDSVRLRKGAVIPGIVPNELGDTMAGAREMMRSLTRMVRRMDDADMGGKFARFVVHVGRISDGVDRLSMSGTEAFAKMGNAFGHLDPGLQRAMARLDESLVKANTLMTSADTMLVENHQDVRRTLSSLNVSLGKLQSLVVSVDSLATGSRADILLSIKNLQEASSSLKDLSKHPWKFFTGKVK